ncbi:MAG TPA: PilZ domain-containing protein [Myxococcales bacterium]|nr:PilZ domain-containing protein [Myxococcales bacterium]
MRREQYEVFGAQVFTEATPVPKGVPRRPATRFPCYALAELRFGGGRRLGILSDISEGGAFVFMDHGPLAGARVELLLPKPGAQAWRCGARVVRVSEDGVALSFDERVVEPGLLVGSNDAS